MPASSLEVLVRAHWVPLVRLVHARLGVFAGRVGAEDLLQRVLLRALQDRQQPRALDKDALYTWALGMVRYEILHAIRDDRRCEPLLEVRSRGGAAQEGGEAREAQTIGEPVMAAVLELCADLQHLPWEQRVLVVTRDFAGASWDTVSLLSERPSLRSLRYQHQKGLDGLRSFREQRERSSPGAVGL